MSETVTKTDGGQTLPILANAIPVGELIPLAKFDAPAQRQVIEIAAGVSLRDSNSTLAFGAAPQRKFSGFLDKLLEGVTAGDVGAAGELVVELSRGIKALNLVQVKQEAEGHEPLLTKLPLVGQYFSAYRRFQAMHTSVLKHVAEIETKANIELGTLKAKNAEMDQLLIATEGLVRELEIHLAGGHHALAQMRAQFQAARDEAAAGSDAMKLTVVRDMAEQINAFETRLVRMQIAFSRALLAIPKIRTTQQAARIEMANTLDSILFDLPDFKSALVAVAALRQITKANAGSEARKRLSRELAELGMDAVESAYLNAKRSQGNMAADVQSLSSMADRMIGLIEKGTELDRENREKRQEAIQQINAINEHLVTGLRDATRRQALS